MGTVIQATECEIRSAIRNAQEVYREESREYDVWRLLGIEKNVLRTMQRSQVGNASVER